MSLVVEKYPDRELGHLVMDNDNYYYVDSCFTNDCGYETMIFPADADGKVLSWSELYVERYSTVDEMRNHHNNIINNIHKYI